ncbi:uncharacterized protein LOC142639829 [Castanea sativa]|uniref:uncharacterized protein LOC142639829 n=1 Tax=Castanea sativa TaxID=21020 RepID=UPI003F64B946
MVGHGGRGYNHFGAVGGGWVGSEEDEEGIMVEDPLSPLLFILVVEVLNRLLRSMEEEGLIKGFEVGNSEDDFVHLDVVDLFEAVSGLRVNLGKGEMVPVGDVENVTELADLLYCKVGSLPMIYLGMPLGVALNQWQFGILLWR